MGNIKVAESEHNKCYLLIEYYIDVLLKFASKNDTEIFSVFIEGL
jgi:hypothetical protein